MMPLGDTTQGRSGRGPTVLGLYRRSGAGWRFYLYLILFLAVVYLSVWAWVLRKAPEVFPVFWWYAMNIGLPLVGGVVAVIIWAIRKEREED